MLELETSDRIRTNGFRGRKINRAVGNLCLHHRMNRQGNDRQGGAAENGKNSKGFGEHEPWVGAEATLLNSMLIADDSDQGQV